jgi:hypothetical protein
VSRLHEREGAAITNFERALEADDAEAVRRITRDPVVLDFVQLAEGAKERDLEAALLGDIERFMPALGEGFYFAGRQKALEIGGEEWVAAFAAAARDANPEVQAAWDSWSNSERRLMAVVSERTTPLQGRVAHERYGVSKTGGNQTTIERLLRGGHIVADETTKTGRRDDYGSRARAMSASRRQRRCASRSRKPK